MEVLIGVDPHKATNAVAAIDDRGLLIEYAVFETSRTGLRSLERWGKRFPNRRWAVEGAGGLGRSVTWRLVASAERVVDVPAKLSSRVRLLSTGNGRKNDQVDALYVALAALRSEQLAEAGEEGEHAAVLRRMLSDRREDLKKERTRALNRLHALLRDLLPGGAGKNLSAQKAARLLRRVRPRVGPAGALGDGWPRSWSATSGVSSGRSVTSTSASGRRSRKPPRASPGCSASGRSWPRRSSAGWAP